MRQPIHRILDAFPEPPPAANGTSRHAGGSASSDTNIVIILAVLLCFLISALGLNSIIRCALQCGRRLAFETPEEAATGLKKRALRRIPVAVYGAGTEIPATDCPICLGEFADGEKVRVLPKCCHGFHVRCIDRWLTSHSSCPTCRRSLLEYGAGEKAGAAGRPGGGAVATRELLRSPIRGIDGLELESVRRFFVLPRRFGL